MMYFNLSDSSLKFSTRLRRNFKVALDLVEFIMSKNSFACISPVFYTLRTETIGSEGEIMFYKK